MAQGAGINIIEAALPWLPALAAMPIALSGMTKKRLAIPLILFIYFAVMLAIAILPPFLEMTATGESDSQLVVGAMAEDIVSAMLLAVINLPLLSVLWFIFRKSKLKQK